MLIKMIRHRKLLKYCVEALVDLAFCKYQIVFTRSQRYTAHYGQQHCETLREDISTAHQDIIGIKCALRVLPRMVPWRSKCLDQAMAGQRMLNRRRLPNTLYFGMMRDENKALVAHAWLRCGDRWIVGYQPHQPHTLVATYAWMPDFITS